MMQWIYRSISALLLATMGCSSAVQHGAPPLPSPSPLAGKSWKTPDEVLAPSGSTPVWKKRLSGYPTDIALDASGNELAVATVPSLDRVGGFKKNQLFWFGPQGQTRWHKVMKNPTRALSIASDGSLMVLSNYNDEIRGYDVRGKKLWTASGTCEPYALSGPRMILCYHDDDAQPGIAFDAYSWSGKKLFSRPASADIVAFKISADEKRVAIGLVGGKAILYGGKDFHEIARASVPGEIADVAPASVGSGDRSGMVVLYHTPTPSSGYMAWVRPNGSILNAVELRVPADQVAIAPDASTAYVCGNAEEGQYLLGLVPGVSTPSWLRSAPQGAHYDQRMIALSGKNGVVTSFFDGSAFVSHITAYRPEGKLAWAIPIEHPANESSYLYQVAVGEPGKAIATAIDDGEIAVYRIP